MQQQGIYWNELTNIFYFWYLEQNISSIHNLISLHVYQWQNTRIHFSVFWLRYWFKKTQNFTFTHLIFKKKQENVNPKSNDNFYALMFVIIDVLILLKQQSNVKSIFLSINTEGNFFSQDNKMRTVPNGN